MRLSLNAACAWRFLCLRSSEVAYIFSLTLAWPQTGPAYPRFLQHIYLPVPPARSSVHPYRGRSCNNSPCLLSVSRSEKRKLTYRFSTTFSLYRLSVLWSWRGLGAIIRRRGHGFFRIVLTLFFLVNGHLVWHDSTGRRRLPIKRQTPLSGEEVYSRVDARVDAAVNTS